MTVSTETSQKHLPWIAALAIFMQSLDGTVLNTALPAIAQAFDRSALEMQSIIVCYTLTLALLIPLSSWLSDKYGSRNTFILAVGIFTLGSVVCALSENLPQLIASRILQAIGGSMMVPVSRLAILYTYEKDKLLAVINFITIPGLIGPIIGPALGGWIVEISTWKWIFLINVPVGIIGMIWAYKTMPNYTLNKKGLDLLGLLLFGFSIILFTLGIELGTENIISKWGILIFLIIGFILMGIYNYRSNRIANPIINLKLVHIRTLRIGLVGNLLTRLGIGGMPLLLPLLYQVGFGHSPMTSGMMMLPVALATVAIKPFVVPLVKKLGYKKTLIINTVLIAGIICLFSTISPDTPLPNLIPLLILYGGANSIQLTAMNTLALADLNNENAGSGNSLLMVMQQLSMSLGISVGAYLLSMYKDIFNQVDIIKAFDYTFFTMGIITFLSGFIFLRLKDSDGDEMSHHK